MAFVGLMASGRQMAFKSSAVNIIGSILHYNCMIIGKVGI